MNSLGGYYIEDLHPGMSASIAKTVTEADIILFAGISTDVNPMPLNEEWARTTQFGGRIAHGMLSRRRCVMGSVCTVNGQTVIKGESALYCSTGEA